VYIDEGIEDDSDAVAVPHQSKVRKRVMECDDDGGDDDDSLLLECDDDDDDDDGVLLAKPKG